MQSSLHISDTLIQPLVTFHKFTLWETEIYDFAMEPGSPYIQKKFLHNKL